MIVSFHMLKAVIRMRTYYVFFMKDEFVDLYYNNPRLLYNVLKKIYYMHKEELHYGFNLVNQITNKLDKAKIDQDLFLQYHNKMIYSKQGRTHYINNLYRDEISTLTVSNTLIKITTNHDYSTFFDYLLLQDKRFFICDFINQDYFWLKQIKILV